MGGNCVVPGTHKRYDELVQRCIALTGDDPAAVASDSGWRPDCKNQRLTYLIYAHTILVVKNT